MKEKSRKFLSDTEIADLYARSRQEANEELVQKYSGFLRRFVVRRYSRCTDDMYQSGVLGLLEAMQDYDPAEGSIFAFSIPYIEKECGLISKASMK